MSLNVFSENESKIKDYQAALAKLMSQESVDSLKLDPIYAEKGKLVSDYLRDLTQTSYGDFATIAINNLGDQFRNVISSKIGSNKENLEKDIDTLFNFLGQVAQELFIRNEKMAMSDSLLNLLNFYFYSPNRNKADKYLALHFTGKLPFLIYREMEMNSKDSVANRLVAVDERITIWNKRLDDLKETEKKVDALSSDLERKRLSFSFLGLSAAFKEFYGRKKFSLYINLVFVFLFGALLIITPVMTYNELSNGARKRESALESLTAIASKIQSDNKNNHDQLNYDMNEIKQALTTSGNADGENIKNKWFYFLPLITIEILLLYYFRISIQNYNNTKSQIMQLETRNAVCQFIEPYLKFKNDNKQLEASLNSFESLVFSNLAPNDEKIPSTFDGLEQLARLIKNIK